MSSSNSCKGFDLGGIEMGGLDLVWLGANLVGTLMLMLFPLASTLTMDRAEQECVE